MYLYLGQSKFDDRNRDFNTIHSGLTFDRFGKIDSHE